MVTDSSDSTLLEGRNVIVKFVPFSTQTEADAVAVTAWYDAVIVAVEPRSFPDSNPPVVIPIVPLLLDHKTLLVILPAEELSSLVP